VPLSVGPDIEGAVIVGVPARVYVPVALPLNTGEDIAGADIVGVPPRVYVPVSVPVNAVIAAAGTLPKPGVEPPTNTWTLVPPVQL